MEAKGVWGDHAIIYLYNRQDSFQDVHQNKIHNSSKK